jgi:HSP20 family protein
MKSWDPFHDLLSIQDRMNKLFEAVLTGPAPLGGFDEIGSWRPAAEVIETPEGLEIHCELAGLDRDEVRVQVEGSMLVVSGERARRQEDEGLEWHRLERSYGKFQRKFELPRNLDLDAIEAELDRGVLEVRVPWRPEARARDIPLQQRTSEDH